MKNAKHRTNQASSKPAAPETPAAIRPNHPNGVINPSAPCGQKMPQHMAAIERRNRNQIEHRQHNIDHHEFVNEQTKRNQQRIGVSRS